MVVPFFLRSQIRRGLDRLRGHPSVATPVSVATPPDDVLPPGDVLPPTQP
jgi:hypothetical protein